MTSAYVGMPYICMAYMIMAYVVMAHILVMAFTVMAYLVKAFIVVAYAVLAQEAEVASAVPAAYVVIVVLFHGPLSALSPPQKKKQFSSSCSRYYEPGLHRSCLYRP